MVQKFQNRRWNSLFLSVSQHFSTISQLAYIVETVRRLRLQVFSAFPVPLKATRTQGKPNRTTIGTTTDTTVGSPLDLHWSGSDLQRCAHLSAREPHSPHSRSGQDWTDNRPDYVGSPLFVALSRFAECLCLCTLLHIKPAITQRWDKGLLRLDNSYERPVIATTRK